jgi:hypothetical protein
VQVDQCHVSGGRPPCRVALCKAEMAFVAPGRTVAGFFMRASMVCSPGLLLWSGLLVTRVTDPVGESAFAYRAESWMAWMSAVVAGRSGGSPQVVA